MKLYKIITNIDTVYYIAALSAREAVETLEQYADQQGKRAEVKTLEIVEGTVLIQVPWEPIKKTKR